MTELEKPSYQGLSENEATKKLQLEGFNELPSTLKQHNIFVIALETIREPMILLLLIAGFIYLILGDPKEAIVLLIFVFVIISILIFQQRKTERVLDTLRDLTSPRALVIREGKYKRIAGKEVVLDDIIVLQEGDRIAADALLLSCYDLRVDESLLTGESVPVLKMMNDRDTYVFSGTIVTQGQGFAKVIATGKDSEIGKIGKTVQEIKPEKTPLQKMINRLVYKFVLIGLCLSIFIIIIFALTRGSWLGGILAGITFAMATLPEEFPVILTVFFALGAWRISKQEVLTRQLPAIESLGSTTVLCVDKTGTLTFNRMGVSELFTANNESYVFDSNKEGILPENYHELILFSILASEINPFDAMEVAFHELGEQYLKDSEFLKLERSLVHEYELTSDLLVMTHVWEISNKPTYIVAAKGAPEAIFKLCRLDEITQKKLSDYANVMAKKGLRVLGIAKSSCTSNEFPTTPHEFDFTFLGLVGLSDPIRPSAIQAIKACQTAGIRVVMITGDYPATALAIAKQLGIQKTDEIITGTDIDKLDDITLSKKINKINVFSRILPRQKLKIVRMFKAQNEIVAMTGDGVNDAPALKAAHIGIAMGQRGTDVAREASSVVLLNDDLSSIVAAIKIGRRIFNNIQKAMSYIFAIHIPIAGLSLIPLLLGWPLLFFPIHIAFLQLIIDPTCSIAFEAEPPEEGIMNRPPREIKKPIFSKAMLLLCIMQGLIILAITTVIYGFALYSGKPENGARALAFTTLVISNLCLILTNRSWTQSILKSLKEPNPVLWWIIGFALLFIYVSLYVPFMRNMFHFGILHMDDLLICIFAGIFSVLWFELLKLTKKIQI